jgi:hypothetical protein
MDHGLYPLEFLYDGNCAICRCDVANLRRRDRHRRIRFIDIADPAFDPAPYGREREALLARITAPTASLSKGRKSSGWRSRRPVSAGSPRPRACPSSRSSPNGPIPALPVGACGCRGISAASSGG